MEEYTGYRMKVTPFRSGDRYGVEVVVKIGHGDTEIHSQVPAPPADWSAENEQDARQYGEDMAKAWIDRRLGGILA